jgi:hypothetical protein
MAASRALVFSAFGALGCFGFLRFIFGGVGAGVAAAASVFSTGGEASAFVAFFVLSLLVVFFVASRGRGRASWAKGSQW